MTTNKQAKDVVPGDRVEAGTLYGLGEATEQYIKQLRTALQATEKILWMAAGYAEDYPHAEDLADINEVRGLVEAALRKEK
jgi:hypothetical protein